MTYEQEMLARAMCHIDDDLILAAHAPRKKLRRIIPAALVACLCLVVIFAFPTLRELVNLEGAGDAVQPSETGPLAPIETADLGNAVLVPDTLGGSTVTVTAVTETTVTFTLVKTDSEPLYIALRGRRGDTLASTEEGFRDNGVLIRPYTLKLTVDGAAATTYHLPTAPGSYTVTLDFSSIRNSPYPMNDSLLFYAYIGMDEAAEEIAFSLVAIAPPVETDVRPETDPTSTADAAQATEPVTQP